MKKLVLSFSLMIVVSLLLAACGSKPYTCTDPMGCITVSKGASIKVGSLLTMSGADSVYGIDAVRGVEIAIADKMQVSGHSIELIKADDECSEQGGQKGATQLAADSELAGVIGTACSSASVPAARIFTDAHVALISPASTAPSLTDPASHQASFLRTIYNDKAQGKAVAEFAFTVLGTRRMVTVHDGSAYPDQLQQAACSEFEQLGGDCILQFDLTGGQDILAALQHVAGQDPDVMYFPLYPMMALR